MYPFIITVITGAFVDYLRACYVCIKQIFSKIELRTFIRLQSFVKKHDTVSYNG